MTRKSGRQTKINESLKLKAFKHFSAKKVLTILKALKGGIG
jgi:hypothetical protein